MNLEKKKINESLVGPGDPEYNAYIESLHKWESDAKDIDDKFYNSLTPEEKAYIQQGGNYIEKMAREKGLRRKKGLLHTERPTYKRDGSISNTANTVKISESQLRDMITESIKKILQRSDDENWITKSNNDDLERLVKMRGYRLTCKKMFGDVPERLNRLQLSLARKTYYDNLA